MSKNVENFINNPKEAISILDKNIGEAEQQQIVAYKGHANYILSVHCVPKKDKFGEYSKHRVIRNGKYKTKNTINLNSIIRKKKCRIPTLPNLKKYAELFLNSSYMALRYVQTNILYKPYSVKYNK